MPKVIITLADPNPSYPIGVNGDIRRFPVGKPVILTDPQLEALKNASTPGMSFQLLPEEAEAEAAPEPLHPIPPEPFDATKFVDRPIHEIGEGLDELDAEQLDAVIAAEKARDNPARSTLIDLLEAKKKAFDA